jgi:hypothetical protein
MRLRRAFRKRRHGLHDVGFDDFFRTITPFALAPAINDHRSHPHGFDAAISGARDAGNKVVSRNIDVRAQPACGDSTLQ